MIPQKYIINYTEFSRQKVLAYANPKYPSKMAFVYKYQPSAIKKAVVDNEAGTLTASMADLNRILYSGKGFVFNFLWFLVTFVCSLICCYQIYDRFSHFISRPIETRVDLIRNSSVKFPSVTLCPYPGNYIPLVDIRRKKSSEPKYVAMPPKYEWNKGKKKPGDKKKQSTQAKNQSTEAKKKGKGMQFPDFCKVDVFDLLNDKLDISTLWDLMSYNGTLWRCMKSSRSANFVEGDDSIDLPSLTENTVTRTVLGTCFTYSFKSLIPFRKDDFVIKFMFNKELPLCSRSKTLFLVHNDDDIITYKVMSGFRAHTNASFLEFGFSVKQFKNLNRTKKPCDTNKVVNECELNCIEKALKAVTPCRLPFSSFLELPLCNSKTNVSAIYNAAMQLALNFDYVLNCSCPKRCDEVVYTDQLKMILSGQNFDSLGFFFDDDMIEEVEEYYSYTEIPFMCDVGGNLGLFLGLSIPAIFQITESVVAYFYKKLFFP